MQLRPYNPETDIEQLAYILSQSSPIPIPVEELRRADKNLPEGTVRQRVAAVDQQQRMIGYSNTVHLPWMEQGQFMLKVSVERSHQRQGLGAVLFEDGLRFAREAGATRLTSSVKDNDPAALRFAEKHGFAIQRHAFTSTLPLDSFDETPFLPALRRAEESGLRFFSLAEIGGATEANMRRFYDLDTAISQDIPGNDGHSMPFADWFQMAATASWFAPDGMIVAAEGDRWVGVAAVSVYAQQQTGYHNMTGVLREYRSRGLATALKVKTVHFARARGLARLRTNNDSQNGPMLAINRKFGYQPEPGDYWLRRESV